MGGPPLVWVTRLDFPRSDDVELFVGAGNVHRLLCSGDDIAYFRVLRVAQPDDAVRAEGIRMVNLISSSVGIISHVTMHLGCPTGIAYRCLAAAKLHPASTYSPSRARTWRRRSMQLCQLPLGI
jgi:hypothetical protein